MKTFIKDLQGRKTKDGSGWKAYNKPITNDEVWNGRDKKFINRLCLVLKWRIDRENSEMVSFKSLKGLVYDKDYLSFEGSVFQDDLDLFCEIANSIFEKRNSNLRVWNQWGEIRAYTKE